MSMFSGLIRVMERAVRKTGGRLAEAPVCGITRSGQQPRHGIAWPVSVQPVAGNVGRHSIHVGQLYGNVSVHLQSAMRRHLVEQRLAH